MFQCYNCGFIIEAPDELQGPNGLESGLFVHAGEGATPSGYKYEKFHVSKARKKGIDNLTRLCLNFGIPSSLKNEMLELFKRFKSRNLEVGSGGVFLFVVRSSQMHKEGGELVTMRQVANFLDVPLSKLSSAFKSVEKLAKEKFINVPSRETLFNTAGLIRCIFRKCQFSDPFTGSDATPRVLDLVEKTIGLLHSHSSQHWEPNATALAAGCLAWQSCFFYRSSNMDGVPTISSNSSRKMGTVREFLALAGLSTSASLLQAVSRNLLRLVHELMELLKKMTWIQLDQKSLPKKVVPKYLDQILEYQKLTCEILSTEAESRYREELLNQPLPIQPRVLSAVEEAALDAPELSEKDLPEHDLALYIRTPAEVKELETLRCLEKRSNQIQLKS